MSVFLSHISEEAPLAAVIKDWTESTFLGRASVFVSSSVSDIPAGSRWLDEIDRALTESKAFLVLCSPRSIERPWVNFETGCGWIKRVPVVPLCHSGQEKGKLPQPISSFQAIEVEDQAFPTKFLSALSTHLGYQRVPRIDGAAMRRDLDAALAQLIGTTSHKSGTVAKQNRELESEFAHLSQSEVEVYWKFMETKSKVATFHFMNQSDNASLTALALVQRGLLFEVANSQNLWFQTRVFGLRDDVYAYLLAHGEIFKGIKKSRDRSGGGGGDPW
jgi:hypothetical protein